MTRPRAEPTRSGRPPYETIARKSRGCWAAAHSAAPPPVLAPRSPTGRPPTSGSTLDRGADRDEPIGQQPHVELQPPRPLVGGFLFFRQEIDEHRRQTVPVERVGQVLVRGVNRLLPLALAKITRPCALAGTASSPAACADRSQLRAGRVVCWSSHLRNAHAHESGSRPRSGTRTPTRVFHALHVDPCPSSPLLRYTPTCRSRARVQRDAGGVECHRREHHLVEPDLAGAFDEAVEKLPPVPFPATPQRRPRSRRRGRTRVAD